MSASKTAEAARKAVEAGEKKAKKQEAKTPEQIIADVRNLLAAKLAVPPDSTRVLLAGYDAALARIAALEVSVTELTKSVELDNVVETLTDVHPHELDRFHDDGGPVIES